MTRFLWEGYKFLLCLWTAPKPFMVIIPASPAAEDSQLDASTGQQKWQLPQRYFHVGEGGFC
jgi:hypothetical protein